MSDVALVKWQPIKWQPKAAAVPAWHGIVVATSVGLAFVLRHPLATAGGLLACLAGLLLLASPTPRLEASGVASMTSRIIPAQSGAAPRSLGGPGGAKATPSAADWIDIVKPLEIFSLETPDFVGAPKTYSARRATSGGRRDVLTLGNLDGTETAIRVSFTRRGHEPTGPAPLFADIARQAAEASFAVTRSGLPDLLTTRFGRMEVADVGLRQVGAAQDDASAAAGRSRVIPATTRACSGFRLIVAAPAFTLGGIACGDHDHAMTRERLGCLMDRLDLTSGGDDQPLVAFFAASELKRDITCRGARLGPDLVHAAWLEHKPAAKVHGRVATRRRIVRHR